MSKWHQWRMCWFRQRPESLGNETHITDVLNNKHWQWELGTTPRNGTTVQRYLHITRTGVRCFGYRAALNRRVLTHARTHMQARQTTRTASKTPSGQAVVSCFGKVHKPGQRITYPSTSLKLHMLRDVTLGCARNGKWTWDQERRTRGVCRDTNAVLCHALANSLRVHSCWKHCQ